MSFQEDNIFFVGIIHLSGVFQATVSTVSLFLLHSYCFRFSVPSHLWKQGSEPKNTSWISSNHSHLRAGWPPGLFWCEQFSSVCIGPSQGGLCKDTVWEQGAPCPGRLVVNRWVLQREQDAASPFAVLLLLIEMEGPHLFSMRCSMVAPAVILSQSRNQDYCLEQS